MERLLLGTGGGKSSTPVASAVLAAPQRSSDGGLTPMGRATEPNEAGPVSANHPGPSREQVFERLRDQRRHAVVEYLEKRGGDRVEVHELSEQITAEETGKPVDQLTTAERKRVSTALRLSHLPKMQTDTIVEYDRDQDIVELTDATDRGGMHPNDDTGETPVPWGLYYTGLAGLSLVLIIGSWLEPAPFAAVPTIGWAVGVGTAFVITALLHRYSERSEL